MNEPTGEDWLVVANDLILVMNDFERLYCLPLTPLATEPKIPSDEALENWEKAFPGVKKKFLEAVHQQMEHRLWMKKNR